MSKKLIPGYVKPRQPRFNLSDLMVWVVGMITYRTKQIVVHIFPRSEGYINFDPLERVFYRKPSNGKPVKLQTPYHAIRQMWQIMQSCFLRADTLEQAKAEITFVRDDLIRLVKKNASGPDARAWRRRLTKVYEWLLSIKHESIEQVKQRLVIFVQPGVADQDFVLRDSIGREGNSGGFQSMQDANVRRVEEAVDDNNRISERVVYHLMQMIELVKELENRLGFVETYADILARRAIENKIEEFPRERDAVRYFARQILVEVEHFWCNPFYEAYDVIKSCANKIHAIADDDRDVDMSEEDWSDICTLAKIIKAKVNQTWINIGVQHLRQDLAEGILNGEMSTAAERRIKKMRDRIEVASHEVMKQLMIDLEGMINRGQITQAYEVLGQSMKTPSTPSNGTTAATTA